jgi:hypothetical protein
MTSKKKIYDNCQALDPQGNPLFYCTQKKANSYLRKDIATLISDNPFIFQLNFEPKGRGDSHKLPKENKCTKCGIDDNLTRHHVIPYFLRKLMSSESKNHRSDDVVPLCVSCHSKYEKSSERLKRSLLQGLKTYDEERKINKKIKFSKSILESIASGKIEGERIPKEKLEEANLYVNQSEIYIPTEAEQIINSYTEEHLIELWRRDFIKWMGQNVPADL